MQSRKRGKSNQLILAGFIIVFLAAALSVCGKGEEEEAQERAFVVYYTEEPFGTGLRDSGEP